MSGKVSARIADLGIELPKAAAPVANYVPWAISGNQLWISGQLPFHNGALTHVGKIGDSHDETAGQEAARTCALNVIAQALEALGNLDRVTRLIRLTGFVNATSDFGGHPEVINGASNLFVEVFGEAGKHTRCAVGMGSLPRDASVEIDAVFEIAD